MTSATLILAAVGAKAFYLLMIWLASAIAASELSSRKGYGEKWGLGTGLLLSAVAVVVWLVVPARPESRWAQRRRRGREATG
jgi:hypothetical protein